MSKDSLKETLVQQQDLYGAPAVNVKQNFNSNTIQALYGVPSPNLPGNSEFGEFTPVLYGPPSYFEENNNSNNNGNAKAVIGGTGISFSIVLFIIGLIAMFSKKISKTAKIIIGSILSAVILLVILLVIVVTNIL